MHARSVIAMRYNMYFVCLNTLTCLHIAACEGIIVGQDRLYEDSCKRRKRTGTRECGKGVKCNVHSNLEYTREEVEKTSLHDEASSPSIW